MKWVAIFRTWEIENGVANETCTNEKPEFNDGKLHCKHWTIPMCVDRTIRCATPPSPGTPTKTEVLSSPDPDDLRIMHTEIRYTCEQRNYYFDYPLSNDFVSYHYEPTMNNIKITCNKEG